MSTVEKRRTSLAKRLGIEPGELQSLDEEGGAGVRFRLQPGGYYAVYSPEEEKQIFQAGVPHVPFLSQIRDDEGKSYNVYLSVEPACAG